MRVNSMGNSYGAGYVNIEDRILNAIAGAIRRAEREGKREAIMVIKDSPALQRALDRLHDDYKITTSQAENGSVKVNISVVPNGNT